MSGDPIRILAVGGTWAKKHEQDKLQWYQKGSPLYWFMMARGFAWLIGRDGRIVFDWTTRLVGHQVWRRVVSFFTRKKWVPSLVDWQVAGSNLYGAINPSLVEPEHWLPACVTHLWMHSHGGNVGFFACADGLKACTFVTFCTPVRADMWDAIIRARLNIKYWAHFYCPDDRIQAAGELGDGDLGVVRKFSELRDPSTGKTLAELGLGPDDEFEIDDGHSGLLNDPVRFDRLQQVLEQIKERHGRPC